MRDSVVLRLRYTQFCVPSSSVAGHMKREAANTQTRMGEGRVRRRKQTEPLASSPALSLVVPTHNDGEALAALVQGVPQVLDGLPYELLLVDDSDGDGDGGGDTPAYIERVLAADPCVRLLHLHAGTQEADGATTGVTGAVAQGILAARGRTICVMTGPMRSGATDLLPALLNTAADADLVVASRHLPGANQPRTERLAHRMRNRGYAALAASLFTRVRRCTDPLSGLFLFRRAVVEGLQPPVEHGALVDILVRGRWKRLTEVPYTHTFDERDHKDTAESGWGESDSPSLRHLRDVRLHGPRGHGPVNYRTLRLPAGADDPQPLACWRTPRSRDGNAAACCGRSVCWRWRCASCCCRSATTGIRRWTTTRSSTSPTINRPTRR